MGGAVAAGEFGNSPGTSCLHLAGSVEVFLLPLLFAANHENGWVTR